MLNSVWAVVREGRIVPLENIEVPEGTRVLVTLLPEVGEKPLEEDGAFWQAASGPSLDSVWNHSEDDVYAKLLEE